MRILRLAFAMVYKRTNRYAPKQGRVGRLNFGVEKSHTIRDGFVSGLISADSIRNWQILLMWFLATGNCGVLTKFQHDPSSREREIAIDLTSIFRVNEGH